LSHATSADERLVARRREVAALSEWQARLSAMSDLMEDAARRKSADPGGRCVAAKAAG
jgi:hypothetical protein